MKTALTKIIKLFVLVSLLAHSSFSCEIGLGAAVDTKIPEITIESPLSSEVIKGAMSFSGT